MFDLAEYDIHPISMCHVEVVTASYKLNGLLKNIPPNYDPDIASKSEILVNELNFQNRYNDSTGHAVRLDIFSRESDSEAWTLETAKFLYRTGLMFTNEDILYPSLTVTNVWLCGSTTQLGARATLANESITLLADDFLMIRTGIVIKSEEKFISYNSPQTFALTSVPREIFNSALEQKNYISISCAIANAAPVRIRFGGLPTDNTYHVEMPPGYNNSYFLVPTRQPVYAFSLEPASITVG